MGRTSANEGIASAEDPQQARSSSAAGDIILECGWLVGQLCVGVGYGIVCPGKVNNRIASIAPSCNVHLVVDDSIRSAAYRVRNWRACGEVGPAIRDRVVLPRVGLSGVD